MGQAEQKNTCSIVCWVIAVVIGIIIFFLLRPGMSLIIALILAALAIYGLAWLFKKLFCGATEAAAAADEIEPSAEPIAEATPEVAPEPETEPVAETKAETEPAPVAKPKPAPAAKPKAAGKPKANGSVSSGPEVLSQAMGSGADDLKKIKGVGPALEKTLNELGIYHFDQIAKWTEADVEWVDRRLKFKGRITRDNWIAQAKDLTGN